MSNIDNKIIDLRKRFSMGGWLNENINIVELEKWIKVNFESNTEEATEEHKEEPVKEEVIEAVVEPEDIEVNVIDDINMNEKNDSEVAE